MQRRVLFLRASRFEDTVLYAVEGPRSIDKVSFRSELKKEAKKRFKKSIGGNPKLLTASIPYPDKKWARKSLLRVNNDLCPGEVCGLYGERQVFFRGAQKPLIVLIGEAPGEEEALAGVPFCGRSGLFLDDILARAGYRGCHAITNTVLCRPPRNRDPERHEKACCTVRLLAFLEKLKPRGVVCVGRHAADTFFPISSPPKGEKTIPTNIMRCIDMGAIRFTHIKHPAYFLRKGGLNTKNKKAKEEIEETIFALALFKELIETSKNKGTKPWVWTDKIPALLNQELKKGRLLVPAV